MYEIVLVDSCFPAQGDFPILETTVGGVLREQAARTPDAPALIEVPLTGHEGRRCGPTASFFATPNGSRAAYSRSLSPASAFASGRPTYPSGCFWNMQPR